MPDLPFVTNPAELARLSPAIAYMNDRGFCADILPADSLRNQPRYKIRKRYAARRPSRLSLHYIHRRYAILCERLPDREWAWGSLAILPIEIGDGLFFVGEA